MLTFVNGVLFSFVNHKHKNHVFVCSALIHAVITLVSIHFIHFVSNILGYYNYSCALLPEKHSFSIKGSASPVHCSLHASEFNGRQRKSSK